MEDEEFLDAMYRQDDEELLDRPSKPPEASMEASGKITLIKIGKTAVEVPTVAYVRQLEAILKSQERKIGRLTAEVKILGLQAKKHTSAINENADALDRKIDRI